MSTDIIYHQLALRFPKAVNGTCEDLYAYVTQIGSSNCYEISNRHGGNGRRSRHWQALALGDAQEVMHEAIRIAGACEGRSLVMRHMRGAVTPEQFIASVRKLLQRAAAHDVTRGPIPFKDGYIHCGFTVPKEGEGAVDREIGLSDTSAVQAWLASADFRKLRARFGASYLLKVWGPELRHR